MEEEKGGERKPGRLAEEVEEEDEEAFVWGEDMEKKNQQRRNWAWKRRWLCGKRKKSWKIRRGGVGEGKTTVN